MNIENLTARTQSLLDEEAARHPEGIKAEELVSAIVGDVAGLLADVERDLMAEAEALARQVAKASRRQRRSSMASSVDYLLDSFASDDGAYVDPMLGLAFPLGTPDGMVKALKYWTEDDWTTSALTAYEKAAEVTASSAAHHEMTEAAKRSMRARGVAMFGVQP